MKEHVEEFRQAFRPPHKLRDTLVVGGTLFVLAAVPVTVYLANQARQPSSKAAAQNVEASFKTPAGAKVEVEDELLVKFKDVATPQSMRSALESKAVTEKPAQGELETINVKALKVSKSEKTKKIDELKKDPLVESVQPNYVYTVALTPPPPIPNDPMYVNGTQWGLNKIGLKEAWRVENGVGENVVVAVVDTGVNQLPAGIKLLPGYDFINNDSDASDDHGHGNWVASIIGAQTNNWSGMAGINWGVSILPVKGLSSGGSGTTGGLSQSIIYAADRGAKVINNSWGCSPPCSTDPIYQSAVDYAVSKGAVVIAAAGNNGTRGLGSPAKLANVIAVGATDNNDVKASFSSIGPELDLVAPGVNIYGAWGSGYTSKSGTSASAAFATGVASLLWAHGASNSVEVTKALLAGYDDLGPAGWDSNYGLGRINAYKALLELNKIGLDSDQDGFSDVREKFVGTNLADKCSLPADINGDKKVNSLDLGVFSNTLNKKAGEPGYNRRYDLNVDGIISIPDVLTLNPYFNKTICP